MCVYIIYIYVIFYVIYIYNIYIYMCVCIYIYIIYIYICMYILYICNHENDVPSRLSPQLLCGGNSCTWAHDVPYIMCSSA